VFLTTALTILGSTTWAKPGPMGALTDFCPCARLFIRNLASTAPWKTFSSLYKASALARRQRSSSYEPGAGQVVLEQVLAEDRAQPAFNLALPRLGAGGAARLEEPRRLLEHLHVRPDMHHSGEIAPAVLVRLFSLAAQGSSKGKLAGTSSNPRASVFTTRLR
jgi:hypothetical protein